MITVETFESKEKCASCLQDQAEYNITISNVTSSTSLRFCKACYHELLDKIRPKGSWRKHTNSTTSKILPYRCSKCGTVTSQITDYCVKCGAKMVDYISK